MLLFIHSLLNQNYELFWTKVGIISVFWIFILLAVLLDLIMGIRASKQVGKFKTHSYGLRKTGRKLLEYWALMLMALFIDFGLSALGLVSETITILSIFTIPLVSIGMFVGIVITEGISVKENIEMRKGSEIVPKKTVQLIVSVLDKLGDNGEDKLKALAEILKSTSYNNNQSNESNVNQ